MSSELELLKVAEEEARNTDAPDFARLDRAMRSCGRDMVFAQAFPHPMRPIALLLWDALVRWPHVEAGIRDRWQRLIVHIIKELRGLRPIDGGARSARIRKTGTHDQFGGWSKEWEDKHG